MTDKEIRYHEVSEFDDLKNLVVVMPSNENLIITCYKNKKALKHIKHKNKRLVKYKN